MDPETDNFFCICKLFFFCELEALDDTGEVTEVEEVVGLGWGGAELLAGEEENVDGAGDYGREGTGHF